MEVLKFAKKSEVSFVRCVIQLDHMLSPLVEFSLQSTDVVAVGRMYLLISLEVVAVAIGQM